LQVQGKGRGKGSTDWFGTKTNQRIEDKRTRINTGEEGKLERETLEGSGWDRTNFVEKKSVKEAKKYKRTDAMRQGGSQGRPFGEKYM